jgi:hypothetical protein
MLQVRRNGSRECGQVSAHVTSLWQAWWRMSSVDPANLEGKIASFNFVLIFQPSLFRLSLYYYFDISPGLFR